MKHKISITVLLLGMFLATQFIGLFIVGSYLPETQTIVNPATGETEEIVLEKPLPYNLGGTTEDAPNFISIVFSFVIAFFLIFLLMKYKWKFIIRVWFFIVVTIALLISLNAILNNFIVSAALISLIISIPLAYLKIFRPNFIVHNVTELLIYPGIAAVFVPLLNPISVIILLILISIYDMWAVWKSGIMQKMAKFQMEELKLFGGFLVPSLSKKDKIQIKNIKQKYKGKKIPAKYKNKKYKVNLAILGGGDIIFPIITSGVFMKFYGIIPALFVMFGALVGLTYLSLITEKEKSYPAMPYITVGIFLGMILARIAGII
ncbi:MAG: presenilin family intramembrane aspartyl protease [Candidatus Pacearchaeota archaeon]